MIDDPPCSFSIVITGAACPDDVGGLLDAVAALAGPPREVCLVLDPDADGAAEPIVSWRRRIKIAVASVRGAALARNIGVALAAGDAIVFLDSGSELVPESLAMLADSFVGPSVACVAGSGPFVVCDRLGRMHPASADPSLRGPAGGTAVFPAPLAAGTAFRRLDLEAIGGFDEEYVGQLDVADACCRLVDAGRTIRWLPEPLATRTADTEAIDGLPPAAVRAILKDKLYFSLVNGRGHHDESRAIADFEAYAAEVRETRGAADADIEMARHAGVVRGRSGQRRLMGPALVARLREPFVPLSRSPVPAGRFRAMPPPRPQSGSRIEPADGGIAESRATLRRIWQDLLPPGTRCALTMYPDHWNVGDAAIWWGTRTLLESLQVSVDYACDPWSYDPAGLRTALPEGPILILGGGNFGDAYRHEQSLRTSILADFPDRRIIQLPQSIWFRDADRLTAMADRLVHRSDFTLLVRDAASLALARTRFRVASHLCPDAAVAVDLPPLGQPEAPVVALWRTDTESRERACEPPAGWIVGDWTTPGDEIRQMSVASRRFQEWVGDPPAEIGTCPLRRRVAWRHLPWLWDQLAEDRTLRGCRLLSRGRVVVTDRLHAHLLCMLMRKPHVVCDSVNGKIFAYRDAWWRDDPLVRFAASRRQAIAEAERLLETVSAAG